MKSFFRIEGLKRLLAKHAPKLLLLQVVTVFVSGYVAHAILSDSRTPEGPRQTSGSEDVQAAEEPTLWTCSMHPQIKKTAPGICPICEMDLVPVKTLAGGQASDMPRLTVSPAARALMSIQTTRVEKRYVTAQVRMVGKIDFDETRLNRITAWVAGRLVRLFVDYTGIMVRKGDHMVSIYSEELHAEQQVLIESLRSARKRKGKPSPFADEVDLVGLSREKLRLLGMTDKQIREIEQREQATDHMTIYAPVGGIVIEKHRQEGDRVNVDVLYE